LNNNFLKTENIAIGYLNSKKIKCVLENINLQANCNELIALIGGNGSGKSTFLRSLAQIQKLLSGNIFIDNQNIKHLSLKHKAKTISYVNTEIINVTNLKVKDLVTLGRFPHTNWIGKIDSKDKHQIWDSLEMVGMLDFSEKFVNELSDGERQRVMIARSLAQDTDIILLDEPTAFLDLSNKYQLIKLLHNLCKEKNKLIIFSSHDLNIILKLVDKIWLIDNKQIVWGAPEDIILNNYLSNIFKNKDLNFNYSKMDFDFEFLKQKPINVINKTNSKIHYDLTIKALERINFYFDENSVLKIIISNENKIFEWTFENQEINLKFDNIYNLINSL